MENKPNKYITILVTDQRKIPKFKKFRHNKQYMNRYVNWENRGSPFLFFSNLSFVTSAILLDILLYNFSFGPGDK